MSKKKKLNSKRLFINHIPYLKWIMINIPFLIIAFIADFDYDKVLFNDKVIWITIFIIILFIIFLSLLGCQRLIIYENYLKFQFSPLLFFLNKYYNFNDIKEIQFKFSIQLNIKVIYEKKSITKTRNFWFTMPKLYDFLKAINILKNKGLIVNMSGAYPNSKWV